MSTQAGHTSATEKHWARLHHLIAILNATPLPEGSEAEAAYYDRATPLEEIIATPATSESSRKVKAEAVAWAVASRTDFALGDTTSERLMTSLLQDLLAT